MRFTMVHILMITILLLITGCATNKGDMRVQLEKNNSKQTSLFSKQSVMQLNKQKVLKPLYFDQGSFAIREDQKEILSANAYWLEEHPNVVIVLEGHCDTLGSFQENIELGQKRVDRVRQLLGLPYNRIKVKSYGEQFPKKSNKISRRVEFYILSK